MYRHVHQTLSQPDRTAQPQHPQPQPGVPQRQIVAITSFHCDDDTNEPFNMRLSSQSHISKVPPKQPHSPPQPTGVRCQAHLQHDQRSQRQQPLHSLMAGDLKHFCDADEITDVDK